MNRLNRRRFLALGAASTASVVLVACGNDTPSEEEMSPTQIPDVAGAPPTLAPITSTPSAEQGGGESGGEGGAATEGLTILALDALAFDPSEAEVSPGQVITLQNDGFLQHDIAVDEWGGELTPLLNNGETAEFTVPEDAEIGATFTYYCTVAGHREGGMEGTFTIVEAGAAAPASEEEAPAEEEGAATGGATEAVTIVALDSLAFDPSELDVAPGQVITLQNDGFLQHDLAVDEWGGELTPLLNNGETAEFTIPEDAAVGEQFVYYCTVAGHRQGGMEGTFTIVEGGAAAPAAGAGEEEATAAVEEEATAEEASGAAGTAEGAATGEPITIIALDSLAFDPSELEVAPGQTIILQNDGFLQHDLAVDEWGGPLTELLNNGDTQEFTIPDDAAVGEQFVYYCTVAGHRQGGMEGTFTIIEGGAAAPAAGAAEEEGTAEAGGTPEAAAEASDPSAVTVTATEWEFSPSEFEVVPGGTITLVNEGTVAHGMTAEAFGGEFLQAGAGQSAEFTVPDDVQPGDEIEFTAVNSNAANLGMTGTITVVEGEGGAAASPAAATDEATPEAGTSAAGAGDLEPITILALDTFQFDPNEVEVAPGQTIILQNDGFLQHDLAVDEWGGPQTELLNNGQTGEFTIPDDVQEGEQYVFYCTVAGHRQGGMEGTFTIVAGGGGGGGGGAVTAASPAASPSASPAASPVASPAAGGSDAEPLTIIALDTFDFDPSEAEVSPGQTIILQNDGFLQHDLAVDEWGGTLTELLNNGQTGEFTIPEDAEVGAEFVYYCTVAGHRQGGMEGTFTIV